MARDRQGRLVWGMGHRGKIQVMDFGEDAQGRDLAMRARRLSRRVDVVTLVIVAAWGVTIAWLAW